MLSEGLKDFLSFYLQMKKFIRSFVKIYPPYNTEIAKNEQLKNLP